MSFFGIGARVPRLRQHDATDCGAACLYAIARYYGRRVPLSRIRQLASTDRQGTTVLGMVEAAVGLGFRAKGVKGSSASLRLIPLPAIAHVRAAELLHYLVVCGASGSHVTVMDPADGKRHRLEIEEFTARWTGILVILAPGQEFESGSVEASLSARLWQLAWPHRRLMVQALIGAVAYTVLGLATAIYVQKVVDNALAGSDRDLLHVLSLAMLAIAGAQAVIGWTKNVLALRTGQAIDATLILGYYRHLLSLPQRFFDTMRVGEILSRMNDAVKIRAFVNDVALDLLVSILVVIFSFVLMTAYSPILALIMMGSIPLYGTIFFITNRLNRRTERRIMERAAELEARLVETMTSVSTIRLFGLEANAALRAETAFVRLLRTVYRSGLNSIGSMESTRAVTQVVMIALFWIGGVLVIEQRLTPGELMSFYALLGYMTGPTAALINANRTVQNALIAADRLFDIMDLELDRRPRLVELRRSSCGDVLFRGVSFRYGTRRQVFRDLDLVIHRGRATAIVGASGCGKSTIAAILHGLHPIENGQVRIGALDLRDITEPSLRSLIAVVPQKVELFSGTVLENIALGEYEPDLERVVGLLDLIGIREMVDRLPGGLHAPVGEDGVELSGGQRQRVAIARALYRDPEILILDEAVSALDPISEAQVRSAIRRFRASGRTVVMIAHRLSGITWADSILVLEEGRVVEEGGHEDLLRAGGHYHQLWTHQFPSISGGEAAAPAPLAGASAGGSGAGWLRSI